MLSYQPHCHYIMDLESCKWLVVVWEISEPEFPNTERVHADIKAVVPRFPARFQLPNGGPERREASPLTQPQRCQTGRYWAIPIA
jgi:hypothetical protein